MEQIILGSSAKQRSGILPVLKVILSSLNLIAGSGKWKTKKEEKKYNTMGRRQKDIVMVQRDVLKVVVLPNGTWFTARY